MIVDKQLFLDMLNSPVRFLKGRVGIYSGSTLELMCNCNDRLKSFSIERIGEASKFFGFGVCQKLSVNLLDKYRELNLTTSNSLNVEFGVNSDYINPYPYFFITEVNRDEKTNELSITAYDAIYKAKDYTVEELELKENYTIKQLAEAIAAKLGLSMATIGYDSFNLLYVDGANFDGKETLREVLDDIAEATQTIYYINNNFELVFKRLDKDGSAVLTIDKEKYIDLDSKTNRRLSSICHATELGDNVIAELAISGTTQYVRNNPFWELREDIAELVNNALLAIGGITINQFVCNWRGNYLLEIGDKIELITKDNQAVISYVLDDKVTFNGSLSGTTQWKYENNEGETAATPTNLGEAIKQTYAKVDKANKQIDIVASETSANKDAISALQLNTDSINASVSKLETTTAEALEAANNNISTLLSKVETQITPEDLKIEITKELANGVDKVTTNTGFTFNDSGLTVSKSGSEMETKITEDGMRVFKDNEEVLKADNEGVKAIDLHAKTYLIIGNNSRFEDYGSSRTGCFWIGGNS